MACPHVQVRLYMAIALLLGSLPLSTSAQIAGFAIFHASADPDIEQVDLYYDDNWIQLGLPFRQLSFRTDVLAGTPYRIGVTPAGSQTFITTVQFTPRPETDYLLLFMGLSNPQRFAPNPEQLSTTARLLIQELPPNSGDSLAVWLAFAHAVTDAPALRLVHAGGRPLYGLQSFGSLTPGLLPADTLTIECYTRDGTLLARFRGDLRDYAGEVGLLVLSGFTQPARNQNGPGLALQAVFLDGTVLDFQRLDTQASTAFAQLIHASPDPTLATVDVYINGQKALDDFSFRNATPLTELPAGVPLQIGLAPGNSQSVADTLRSFTAVLPPGVRICAIVSGVLNPQEFAPNPGGSSTELTLLSLPALERSSSSTSVALALAHAVTDAGPVSMQFGTIPLAAGRQLQYGEVFAPYEQLPAVLDTLRGLPQAYLLDLSPHGGKAGVIVLTGFADPAANKNGPSLVPIVAFSDGTVVQLSPVVSVGEAASVRTFAAELLADELRIYVPEAVPSATVELLTLMGKRLGQWTVEGKAGWVGLPLGSPIASGLYLCRLTIPQTGYHWARPLLHLRLP